MLLCPSAGYALDLRAVVQVHVMVPGGLSGQLDDPHTNCWAVPHVLQHGACVTILKNLFECWCLESMWLTCFHWWHWYNSMIQLVSTFIYRMQRARNLSLHPAYHTQATDTYWKICSGCTPFEFFFLADGQLSHIIAEDALCIVIVGHWQLWYRSCDLYL